MEIDSIYLHENSLLFKYPIIVSLCCYAVFIMTGSLLRHAAVKYLPSSFQSNALDLITSFQVLGCSLENGQVRTCYGNEAFFIAIYCQSFWLDWTLDGSTANPCCHVKKCAQGRSSISLAITSIIMQCIGAVLSWQAAQALWMLGLTAGHRHRWIQSQNNLCHSDLTVSVYTGMVIESLACSADCLLSLMQFTKNAELERQLKYILFGLLTVVGIPFTGLYMNPLNASNQTMGCHGNTILEHLLVYWIGPFTAVALTTVLLSKLSTEKTEKKIA